MVPGAALSSPVTMSNGLRSKGGAFGMSVLEGVNRRFQRYSTCGMPNSSMEMGCTDVELEALLGDGDI